jgi:hypothetical protein
MCEGCCGKVPDDDKTDETVMDANVLDSKQRIDDALNSPGQKFARAVDSILSNGV